MSESGDSSIATTARILRESQIDTDDASLRYWLSVPIAERLAAVEQIRSEFHAWRRDDESRLKELVALLLSHEVRFLISGGHALAVHGHPRYTKNLDIWLAKDRANLDRTREAILAFGFAGVADDLMSLEHGRAMLQLGREPNRVDLLSFATGLDFEAAWPNRIDAEFEGLSLSFLGLEDFKTNKRATGRLGDLADLERLGEKIDPAEAAAAVGKGSTNKAN